MTVPLYQATEAVDRMWQIAEELRAERDALRAALERLERAETCYRRQHDLRGAGSREAGLAWDAMRYAGDAARAAIRARAEGGNNA